MRKYLNRPADSQNIKLILIHSACVAQSFQKRPISTVGSFIEAYMWRVKLRLLIVDYTKKAKKVVAQLKFVCRQQKLRAQIFREYWAAEETAIRTKPSLGGKKDLNYNLIKVMESPFYCQAKEAVILKWMTYCKTKFLDDLMQWRMSFLKFKRLGKADRLFVKTQIGIRNQMHAKYQKYISEYGIVSKKYESFGPKIESCFPLLDPSLNFQDALSLHSTPSPDLKFPLTSVKLRDRIQEMIAQMPVLMPFLPSQHVLHQLIVKTGFLLDDKDIRMQINPKELKKFFNNDNEQESNFQPYMQLRIEHRQVKYPDLRDRNFYKQTSLRFLLDPMSDSD